MHELMSAVTIGITFFIKNDDSVFIFQDEKQIRYCNCAMRLYLKSI